MTLSETTKNVLDVFSVGVAGGVILQIIPALAGLFSIVWLGWQMYDRIKYGPKINKEE